MANGNVVKVERVISTVGANISATMRRSSLGEKGFSMTRRPLLETNLCSATASESPVTNTTRPATQMQAALEADGVVLLRKAYASERSQFRLEDPHGPVSLAGQVAVVTASARGIEPDQIAGAALLLASRAGSFITGQASVVDVGVTI